MYAVFETGGKQYRVQEGDTLRVERLAAKEGSDIHFDKVLMIGDGESSRVGTPYVQGGKITATVKGHGRGEKVRVVKFRRRARYRRHLGHRQDYTELQIKGIAPGKN